MYESSLPVLFPPRPFPHFYPIENCPFDIPYDLPPTPPPFIDMAGPIRTGDTAPSKPPPRPPNAWILYRSDKLKSLPPVPAGAPRRAQADVSREISLMWKNETEIVRSEYERRAELKKAQHQQLYPNYRYHPVSKAEKERLREEKKAEKERERATSKKPRAKTSPYATTVAAPPLPPMPPFLAQMSMYRPETHFGPGGPSPPLSAASSPGASSVYDEPTPAESQHSSGSSQPTSHASSSAQSPHYPRDHPASRPGSTPSSRVSSYSSPRPRLPVLPSENIQPSVLQQPPQFYDPWPLPHEPHASSSHQAPATWLPTSSSQTSLPEENYASGSNQDDLVLFPMPSLAQHEYGGWGTGDISGSDTLQGLLAATDNPDVFALSGFHPDALIANPTGEIEISMGSQLGIPMDGTSFSQFFNLFDNFDLTGFEADSSLLPDIDPSSHLSQTMSPGEHRAGDASSSYAHGMVGSSGQQTHHPSGDFFAQYLHLDAFNSQDSSSTRPATPQHRNQSGTTHNPAASSSAQPYAPPAGAANSSTRRVGASWKPPAYIVPDSPIERSAEPWGVHAN